VLVYAVAVVSGQEADRANQAANTSLRVIYTPRCRLVGQSFEKLEESVSAGFTTAVQIEPQEEEGEAKRNERGGGTSSF
jgi:hypothetical protein